MQEGIRSQTGTTDVSGIPMNFRCHQDDMTFGLLAYGMGVVISQFWCNNLTKSQFFTAIWAVGKFCLYQFTTVFTIACGFSPMRPKIAAEIIGGMLASLTADEGFTLFDSQHRDEKQIQVMIDLHLIGLVQTAMGTASGIFVYFFCFWGYSADENKHCHSLTQ